MTILSFAKQQEIKIVSNNNQAKFEQLMQEVEGYEVDKLLGSAFYQDVDANPANYTDLLEGSSFIDCHGNTVKHKGLYYVIAYLNYAEYIPESKAQDTFTGFVGKTRPNSENLSSGEIKNLTQRNKEIAFNAWELVKDYIESDTSAYPLWNCKSDKRVRNFNITGIKNTLR